MYKNVYYDYDTGLIHLWDDKKGYNKIIFEDYCYVKTSEKTKYKSIFGDNVKKRANFDYNSSQKALYHTFESDVNKEVRFLVDKYYQADRIPENVKIMAFDIETSRHKRYGHSTPEDAFNSILSISTKLNTGEKVAFLHDPDDRFTGDANIVKTYSSEIAMLKAFLNYWDQVAPDIITGWYSQGYDIPYLYNRIRRVIGGGVENNLSPVNQCRERNHGYVTIAGISHLDYMELYQTYTYKKLPSYSLEYVSQYELGEGKVEYDGDLQKLYENDIDRFMEYNIQDVDLIFKLDKKLNFINQNMVLACKSHIPFEFALKSTMVHEGSFLTETKKENLVVPDKPDVPEDVPLIGAYVKDSKKGLFEWIYDQDLTSLYPMIIVTNNISPETKAGRIRDYIDVWREKNKPVQYNINHPIFDPTQKVPDKDEEINIIVDMIDGKSYKIRTKGHLYAFMREHNLSLSGNGIFFSKDEIGIIPKIMLKTFEERAEFKALRNKYREEGNEALAEYYDMKQMAWKINLNSFYGVMGNKGFRFFDQDLAQSITMTGQFVAQTGMNEVIRIHQKMWNKLDDEAKDKMDDKMKSLFEDPHLTGDTDSVILTAMPILYYKFGNDWVDMPDEELVEVVSNASHEISKIINKRMQLFADEWLNSDNNKLSYKEEWVARRGFYVGVKKRYANSIIWEEGVSFDEPDLDVKGLDIVRSDFPSHLQDFMREILETLLEKGEVKQEIMDYIVSFKEQLHEEAKEDIMKIAKISSVKTMEKYTIEESSRRWKTRTPFAVKGSICYNSFLEINGLDKEYKPIHEGDKVACVYLDSNRYGYEQVSFPLDFRKPEEFDEFIRENTNIHLTISKLLDNKLQTYYDAMDWQKPDENYNSIENLLV